MKEDKVAYFKDLLLEKRREVKERIKYLREIVSDDFNADGDNSRFSFHMADQGTDANEREITFLLLSREIKYLQQIERSLNAVELGEYGICRICGKEISEERLKAVPTARTCVPCKQAEFKKSKLLLENDIERQRIQVSDNPIIKYQN